MKFLCHYVTNVKFLPSARKLCHYSFLALFCMHLKKEGKKMTKKIMKKSSLCAVKSTGDFV